MTKTFVSKADKGNVRFQVDLDSFEAISPNKLPAGVLATYFELIQDGKLFEAHLQFFESVLTPESYEKFKERINSKESPITLQLLGDICTWLLGDVFMGN